MLSNMADNRYFPKPNLAFVINIFAILLFDKSVVNA